ncbi:MAG: ABC transporter substrate-binding protein [Campylobacterales bacterium]|nr:ABC transporter substrate-binding protein [Campylobacterales bacterium]
MKKYLFILSLLVVSLFSSEAQKVSIQLLWKHQFEFAGFYVAKEKGFYKDVGLDVQIKEYDFGTNIAKDVSEGKSDFGVDSSSLILDKVQGLDVYLLMPLLQTSPFVLMTKKRDDLKTVADLKGKRVMLTPNQITMASLNAMFKVNHLSNSDFINQQHSFNTQDLIDDKTDAMSVYLSNEPYYMIEKGLQYTILNPSNFGFDFYDNILFTSKRLLQQDPQLVENFYKATQKGWEYAYHNPEEASKIIFDKYNTQNKSIEHLMFEAKELEKMSHFGLREYEKFKPAIISQIIQTYNLLDISKSSIDIKEFIYPDAMYVESSIDYVLLWKILGVIVILFVGLYYWNRKLSGLNKLIQKSRSKITILLDNAGQGFLTFDKNFKIDVEYSKECIKLLGEKIASQDIAKILFHDVRKQEFFKSTLLDAQNETMEMKRNAYLSLLPTIIILNKKALKLEYKVLEDENFMLILTNISSQKKLENKIKKEQEVFKMIVSIVSETQIFYDTKDEYLKFINSIDTLIDENKSPQENLSDIYRAVHTFKGAFSQLYMEDVVQVLHNVESEIAKISKENVQNSDALKELLKATDFRTSFEVCLDVIKDVLGAEFLDLHNFVKIDLSNIQSLQEKIAKVFNQKGMASLECQDILSQVQTLSSTKLFALLKPYIALVSQLAMRFEKEIYELEIDGDTNLAVPEKIKPFVKSLIHVFRNSIDHGIELPEKRFELEKDEKGTIVCKFEQVENTLKIMISDDGMGIDIEKIKEKLESQNIDTANLTHQEFYNFIFKNEFSTKESVTDISGRGVGMGAVKAELDKLGGVVEIKSAKNVGTTFIFVLPL